MAFSNSSAVPGIFLPSFVMNEPHETSIVPEGSTSMTSPVAFTLALSFSAALICLVCSATQVLHLLGYDLLNSEICLVFPHTSHFFTSK